MSLLNSPQWTWKQFFICFAVAMGTLAFSYPASIIGTTLAQPSFLSYMSLLDSNGEFSPSANALIGSMSGVFQAGGMFGIFSVTYIMTRWGRKAGLIFCSVFGLVGGALVCASQNVTMFIVFRFIAGAGSWAFLVVSPVYTAELAPPGLRGLFVGMNGLGIALGYALATYMGLAFYHSTNTSAQWRGPYGLALIFSALPLAVIFFVPESPRWLLMVSRDDEARQVVKKLHNLKDEDKQHFAIAEFYQMQRQIDYDRTMDPSWWQMVKRPSYRKRVIMTAGYACLAQSTAVLVINNYGPILFGTLGFGTEQKLILQCGWITCGIGGNFTGALIMDRVGRKPLMIFGIAGCLICLIIEAAMVASFASPVPENPNIDGIRMAIAAFYIFIFLYGCGVDVAGLVFFGEVYPNHLRAKGMAITIAANCLSSLVYLEIAATAFAAIGWKFYMVFISICAVGLLWICFVLPETKGVPLEEVAALFGDQDEVVVFSEDIQMKAGSDEIVVKEHHGHEKSENVQEEKTTAHHEIAKLSA